MHTDNKCRLCYNNANQADEQLLYDENGQCSEIYEITVKYFDPMLLVNYMETDSKDEFEDKFCNFNRATVLCKVCWGHIREFHDFQQDVFKTQTKLTEDIKISLAEVKEETEIKIEIVHNSLEMDPVDLNGFNGNDDTDDNTDDIDNNYDALPNNIDADKKDTIEISAEINETVLNDDYSENLESTGKRRTRKTKNFKILKNDSDDIDNNEYDVQNNKCNNIEEYAKKTFKNVKKNNNTVSNDDHYEQIKSTRKSHSRKTKKSTISKNDSDNEDSKTVHYNTVKKIEELDNFISEIKPLLECDICKDNLENYNDLRQHFTEKHQTKCYIICCGRKIYRRYLLVEHLKIHVNPDTFKCDICGASSASSRSLNSHKRFMHSSVEMKECNICHKQFKTNPILLRHMEIHNEGAKDFKCPECERSYASDYQLKAHITKVHQETRICEQCGKNVHGTAALRLHIIHQHSGIKPAKIPCDQCDAQLASKKGLNAHKLSFHNDGLTAFICKVCGKVASSENALLRHKKYVHEMERKHKCQYCDKAFKKSANLKEHISIHTGQHMFQCPHCRQTFANSANMHNHRKKSHPVEFALSREKRIEIPKVDLNSVVKEVVL